MAIVMGIGAAWAGEETKSGKDTVTFLVSMSCENCQKRIEGNIAYEKGVTGLDVNLAKKTVTIEYDAEKTTPAKLKEAIQKLGYTAAPMKGGNKK